MALWKWKMNSDAPASPHVNDVGAEPREPMTEARRRSLEDVMEATLLCCRDQIIKEGRWNSSDATREAERRIDEIYESVMAGRGKLLDFRAACEDWMKKGQNKNETYNDKITGEQSCLF